MLIKIRKLLALKKMMKLLKVSQKIQCTTLFLIRKNNNVKIHKLKQIILVKNMHYYPNTYPKI